MNIRRARPLRAWDVRVVWSVSSMRADERTAVGEEVKVSNGAAPSARQRLTRFLMVDPF
jgi:hypothetical protein